MTSTDEPLPDLLNQRGVGLGARLDLAIERALEDRRLFRPETVSGVVAD